MPYNKFDVHAAVHFPVLFSIAYCMTGQCVVLQLDMLKAVDRISKGDGGFCLSLETGDLFHGKSRKLGTFSWEINKFGDFLMEKIFTFAPFSLKRETL